MAQPDEPEPPQAPDDVWVEPEAAALGPPVYERKELPWHRERLLLDPRVKAAEKRRVSDPDQLVWDACKDPAVLRRALETARFTLLIPRVLEALRCVLARKCGGYATADRIMPPDRLRVVARGIVHGPLSGARLLLAPAKAWLRGDAGVEAFLCETLREVHPGAPDTFAAPPTPGDGHVPPGP